MGVKQHTCQMVQPLSRDSWKAMQVLEYKRGKRTTLGAYPQCSPYQAVTGKIYRLQHCLLPVRTTY